MKVSALTGTNNYFEDFRVGEVLKHALVRMPEPIEWVEPVNAPAGVDSGEDAGKSLAH